MATIVYYRNYSWPQGLGQLTPRGMRRAHQLGQVRISSSYLMYQLTMICCSGSGPGTAAGWSPTTGTRGWWPGARTWTGCSWRHSASSQVLTWRPCLTQVPETSVNRDGGVREKFMFPPSILTQGSVDWGFLQISISRILHSCQNYRWNSNSKFKA